MPGMDGTGELFAPFLSALGTSFEPLVLRYPTNEPLGYADLLGRVRAELPKSDSYILLGESFSGPLALMLAAESPAGLRGVVLCASFVTNPIPWFPRFASSLVRPAFFRGMPYFVQAKALLARYDNPDLRALLLRAISAVSPAVMAARARAIFDVDVSTQFQTCTYPILYLRGQHDWVVGKRIVKSLLACRASLNVVTLPAPHLVLQVAPKESARAIREFVDGLGST